MITGTGGAAAAITGTVGATAAAVNTSSWCSGRNTIAVSDVATSTTSSGLMRAAPSVLHLCITVSPLPHLLVTVIPA